MDVITLALAKAHVNKQEFWTDKNHYFHFNDYINLTTAMMTPGGEITINAEPGSDLEERLSETVAALFKGPATIVIRPEDNQLLPVRVISWLPQAHFAMVSTVVEYAGLILLVSFQFHLNKLIYSVKAVTATPMVPAT
jgi:hypothetical protein